MLKDSLAHFKKKWFKRKMFLKYLLIITLVTVTFSLVCGVGLLLITNEVAVNFIVIAIVSLSGLMYTLLKPISNDIENLFQNWCYYKTKLEAQKVDVSKTNEIVSELVKKGFIIERISTMGSQDVLITYFVPLTSEEEKDRKNSIINSYEVKAKPEVETKPEVKAKPEVETKPEVKTKPEGKALK